MNKRKLLQKAINSPKNLRFEEFVQLIVAFGFVEERVSGSHHIFKRAGIHELLNIQDVAGMSKPYQIRQFLSVVERYNLRLED